jgi:ring-1,2-phenylacetyl-CoA epoxidase subunit PaaC
MAATESDVLAPELRGPVRDLILALADSKRLLGMRYAQWVVGAPELEAGIACASMAQDEWGHARLLYAMLKEFGEDVDALEHARAPEQYHSMAVLDEEPGDWPGLVALNALADVALTVQFEAMAGCCYPPLRQRVEKLLEEERFHAAHGAAWIRRLAGGGDASAEAMREAARAVLPQVLSWFGPDSEHAQALKQGGVADATGGQLRRRFLDRIAPLLQALALHPAELEEPGLGNFDEARRRGPGAPDARTIARVRGDKNRPALMD